MRIHTAIISALVLSLVSRVQAQAAGPTVADAKPGSLNHMRPAKRNASGPAQLRRYWRQSRHQPAGTPAKTVGNDPKETSRQHIRSLRSDSNG
jgi:hypothetical protein